MRQRRPVLVAKLREAVRSLFRARLRTALGLVGAEVVAAMRRMRAPSSDVSAGYRARPLGSQCVAVRRSPRTRAILDRYGP